MKFSKPYHKYCIPGITMIAVLFSACKKDGNPNNLPDADAAKYAGTIDGYKSSDEVASANLVAYWDFEGTNNEKISGANPTTVAGNSFVEDGVKGKALSLNAGYLYYPLQLANLKTDVFQSFTVSTWVQILNNGSKRTMLFQLARPGVFNGSLNFILNTQSFPATNTDELKINPTFTAISGGMQDNVNTKRDNPGDPNYFPYLTPKIGASKWTHLLLTYESTTGMFHIWADGVKVGAFPSRNVGTNLFKSYEPGEIIIGGNYNVIPGKSVNTDVSFAAMTGKMDELKIWNIALTDAHIKAIYNLGLAKK
ncbi:LamG-like jellyroll fold domain-containing protein [Pedobacter sp. MC2016-24]|uniref:LamG-like jellyroll fold domain-containing protein n=1 Tax=Pedobacter sp. MC2016-24 TaxID=2780090 RepID=UPI0018828A50|nr:LamG-like jellyroll fold domain-containing protein [Pedobacter sp. MC2016-24]MBE9602825.1 LamG domain-containing protein [Pedobacter sp. MC2016-24]